ncbi:potassium channel subfamily K member 13 [Sarcophilus harrisii]|uniref:Potassium two pore domain channel subfamily K member 13 n=1 Tax=Sarcophilus harrisii TaxID=9305 RepID=A0A7N4PTB1_SARHA|nr:potassium channel subfamily K member 13 [Sarcophilus harrisii]XP_031808221.1 potassium channel subfamily K member 13 [Sarcophilus harrisii]
MASQGCGCCWTAGHLNLDNVRFLILAILIVLYMVCGAAVFSAIERANECRGKELWREKLLNFSLTHNLSLDVLGDFLRNYEEAKSAGIRIDDSRPRWDFTGAFYFVGTVVSTIGFGMTAPATVEGKVFLIFYGLIGCSGTILFFNLFLERLITVITYVMRLFQETQIRKRELLPADKLRTSGISEQENTGPWKPSVYYVMLILCVASLIISCCASAMYTPVEGWTYFDSFYFCFVAFSTIGFGDLVSSQNAQYSSQELYRFGNFVFILLGVCCIYSLFNVISILIKQFINWMVWEIEFYFFRCQRKALFFRRNAVTPSIMRNGQEISIETDGVIESETDEHRPPGETASVKDFKGSLATPQKPPSEAANGGPRKPPGTALHTGFSGGVGALGIMNNRLVETSGKR